MITHLKTHSLNQVIRRYSFQMKSQEKEKRIRSQGEEEAFSILLADKYYDFMLNNTIIEHYDCMLSLLQKRSIPIDTLRFR